MKKLTTQEFISKARQVHGDMYNYANSVYIGSEVKLTVICPIHGEFTQVAQSHLAGRGCKKCSILSHPSAKREAAKQTFIERVQKIHGDRYDYSETIYKTARIKVSINCRKHGQYLQNPIYHLRGMGCPLCGHESTTKAHIENPMGWTAASWQKVAKTSKEFDGFKVYLLELSSKNEKFYKIGRTFNKTETRTNNIPYNCKIIHEIRHEDAKIIFDLENELKRKYKKFQYSPLTFFGGRYECFSVNLPVQDIIEQYSQTIEVELSVSNLELPTET